MPREPTYRIHSSKRFAFYEHQGKRIRLPGKPGEAQSKAAYFAFLARWRASHGQPLSPPPPVEQCTVEDICTRYLAFAEIHYDTGGDKTELQNVVAMVRHLNRNFAHLRAVEFGPKNLKNLRDRLAREQVTNRAKDKEAPRKRLSRGYVNWIIARVRRMFRWAASEELVPAELCLALETVAGLRKGEQGARETSDRKPARRRDVVLAMRRGRLPRVVRDMIRLHRLTGVRSQSLCQATPEQFDRSKLPWLWRPKHKTEHLDRELVVPIGPKARRVLARWLDRTDPEQFVFRPTTVRRDRRYGSRYTANSYANAIARGIRKANSSGLDPAIAHWTPHQLRHALGEKVREKYGVEAAQAMLGHDSLDATQIYTSRRLSDAVRIAEEIG